MLLDYASAASRAWTVVTLGRRRLLPAVQLSAGSLRQKNARNIIFKNLMDACLGAVCFYLVGYGFAYGGEDANKFIGWSGFALSNQEFDGWYSWFFQYTVRLRDALASKASPASGICSAIDRAMCYGCATHLLVAHASRELNSL